MSRANRWLSVIVTMAVLIGVVVTGQAWASPADKATIHVLLRTGAEADSIWCGASLWELCGRESESTLNN